MGQIILDEDLMIHILNNLPGKYKSKIEVLEKDMEDTVKPSMVVKLKKELHNKYGKICKYKGYKAGKEKETNENIALAMLRKLKADVVNVETGVIS